MTREHLYFIPIVFSLGIILGTQVTRWRLMSRWSSVSSPRHVTLRGLLVPMFAFAGAFLLTHVFSMHGGVQSVENALGGQAIFDQRASFSAEEVYERLTAFGPEGRAAYQHMTFTTDAIFPLILFAFLIQLTRFVSERVSLRPRRRLLALSVPMLWLCADLMENATVFHLIESYPNPHRPLAALLGVFTSVKFGLLLAAVAVPAAIGLGGAASWAQPSELRLQAQTGQRDGAKLSG